MFFISKRLIIPTIRPRKAPLICSTLAECCRKPIGARRSAAAVDTAGRLDVQLPRPTQSFILCHRLSSSLPLKQPLKRKRGFCCERFVTSVQLVTGSACINPLKTLPWSTLHLHNHMCYPSYTIHPCGCCHWFQYISMYKCNVPIDWFTRLPIGHKHTWKVHKPDSLIHRPGTGQNFTQSTWEQQSRQGLGNKHNPNKAGKVQNQRQPNGSGNGTC